MNIYIVRHGESEGNAQSRHQSASTPLSEIGRYQANLVAHRLKNVPIDVIVSSDLTRTRQTAEIINSVIHKPIELASDFREVKRPSEIEGKLG